MPGSVSTKAFRSTPCRNPFVSALLYVCSLFAMTPLEVLDMRPHLIGALEGSDTIFLVDTGSAVSCISEEKYRSLPSHWTLEEVPPDHGLRLSSASGHDIWIVGRFFCTMNFQGRQIRRPMYILRGFARHKAILGIDFVKEQHLRVDASGPHFKEAANLLPDNICALFTQSGVCVPPTTVRRLTVCPKASSGLKCPPGATGIVSSDTDDYDIWDAASTVQDDSRVDIIFMNTSWSDIKLLPSTPIGYLQLIDPSEGKPLDETTMVEI